ncbi:MAG: hypothetical protein HOA57_03990 [Candidatus Magasanikbacteria bacterium]|jgi:membrane protein YqaA with SNARE-associated domain|nr:hypothetical protein [Candidatus Magasanikbacteria bacterium]MBT4314627.1 hypothetical protein [Candidatus Magasanikbacteria bacterium]MBT4547048.1 hypothetical protein [Candidatus Magasanikbacteria bacterium]MBT6819508.1 hypothetical protein [Candidatus Magasanikbacteria bacterium]
MKKHLKLYLKITAIIAIFAFVVLLNKWAIGNGAAQELAMKFGYLGIFIASIISGFNLVVPVPIIGFYPFFLDAGFTSYLLIIIISSGMMLGDVLGFLIGQAGRDFAMEKKKNFKIFTRLEKIHNRYPRALIIVLLFYAAFVPLPNEIIVIPMAFLGYKFRYMILALFVGNLVFNSLAAFGFFHLVNF